MGKSVSEIPDRIKEIQIAGISCSLFLPEGYSAGTKRYPVVYINGEISVEEVLEEIRKAGVGIDFILLSVKPESWNDDFTPWGAPAFRKGEAPPQGRAKEYIYRLSEEIKPYMDANYRTKPEREDTVLLGYDNRMGCDAAVSEDVAREAGALGLEVVRTDMVSNDCGAAVSSTKIRKCLEEGDVQGANGMLGYSYSLHGVVVAGNRLGRTMGFPTANMQLYEPLKLVPGNGVYSVRVKVLGREFFGMCNIGLRQCKDNRDQYIRL